MRLRHVATWSLLGLLFLYPSTVESNITRFCICYENDWGKIYIRGYIHKRHPISGPHGELWGVFCEDSGENWQRYNGTVRYMMPSWHRKDFPYFWLFGVGNPLLTGGFLLQKSVMRSFNIFFVVNLNKLLNNSRPAVTCEAMTLMWLHCDDFFYESLPFIRRSDAGVDILMPSRCITVTSKWARRHFKLPASRLFAQSFIQAQIKGNIEAPRHWPLWGEFTGDRWICRTKGQ